MTASEAQANPDTISSIMTIFGTPARVLFYSGSSKSFVSISFTLHADRELSPLKYMLVVMTLLKEQIICTSVFKGCEVLIERVVLKKNLISLEMWNFDIILGMDWLSTHRVSVDCFTKKVVFRKLGFPKLKFEGDRRILPTCVISALEAKRLLHKSCEVYLAHVIDTSTSKVTLENVSVVREFLDVFLKDLPRLPPDRELEFGIDFLLKSAPISIPPYRMALVELKKLKTQLQDLVDKDFIRPSVSP